ncbi:MAG: aspartate aminotransferase family protein [Nitrospirae bacterium]|nr:aspartate aminotransferase family protein [Nitrospirota bacterium]
MDEKFFDIPYDRTWWKPALPVMKTELPGPKSKELYSRGVGHSSFTGRVKLCPVVFDSGKGVILRDVDGNEFLDFSSGIYVTNLGHSHPKVSEAVARYANRLMNCHDYMTEVKSRYLERLSAFTGHGIDYIHLYDNGTTAIEFGIRVARRLTNKYEVITVYQDHHGKTMGAASLGRINATHNVARPQGFYMVPRADPYRPIWTKPDGTIDTDRYIEFYDLFIREVTADNVAAFIVEPIQGWGGSMVPPDDFLPKLSEFCRSKGIFLMADEILTGSGRTGKWLACEHWSVEPEIVTLGKGLGNGFPLSALLTKSTYAKEIEPLGMSTTYGGNPMACAAGLAVIEVVEEEGLLENAVTLGRFFLRRLNELKDSHPIIGDVRGKGCLLGIEFVKDRVSKEPLAEAGGAVYLECIKRGLIAGVPVVHLLRVAPPVIMDEETAIKGLEILDEAITAVERRLGYA